MKHYLLRRTILIVFSVLSVLVAIVACKKDKLTEPSPEEGVVCNSYESSEVVVRRIKDFDHRLKQVRQGLVRADYSVDIDSALWDIESLFNASFSFPDRIYVEKKIQELSFTLNVCDAKTVKMKDVADLYDDIIESVREAYRNDGFVADKSLMTVVIKKGEMRSGGLDVGLLLVSGRVTQKYSNHKTDSEGPFQRGDCWYFGEYGGSCNDPDIVYDAAKALEDMINFNYGNKIVESGRSDDRSIYVGMRNVSLAGNEYWDDVSEDYYIYYKVNCPDTSLYLNYQDLNRYYYNMLDVIFEIVPEDAVYSSVLSQNPNFMEVAIDGLFSMDGKNTIHNHNTNIIYGSKHIIKKTQLSLHIDLLEY